MVKFEGNISVERAEIVGVEAGNCNKTSGVERYVCTFAVESELGYRIKVLLKGPQALFIYTYFLKENHGSRTDVLEGFKIDKKTLVSFTGKIREIRKNEIVLDNMAKLDFHTDYAFSETGE